MSKWAFVVAGLGTVAMPLLAEEPSAPNVTVQVIVTVEARHGKDVPSLNREDFMAYQRHERLPQGRDALAQECLSACSQYQGCAAYLRT
jgi:hypothetical protein